MNREYNESIKSIIINLHDNPKKQMHDFCQSDNLSNIQKYGSFSNIKNSIRIQIFCPSDICGCWFGNYHLATESQRSHVHEEPYKNGSDSGKQHTHSFSISDHLSQFDAFFRYHIHIRVNDNLISIILQIAFQKLQWKVFLCPFLSWYL